MIDLLSHYEEEGRGAWYSGRRYEEEEKEETSLVGCPLTTVVDSASLLTPPSPPQDVVMAARLAEEEQAQRTMIALNEMTPSYPGKSSTELQRVLDEVHVAMM